MREIGRKEGRNKERKGQWKKEQWKEWTKAERELGTDRCR